MKDYQRLALFLVVLLLSLGMLSTAINLLGDIRDLDLEEDVPGRAPPSSDPAGLTRSMGEEVQVDSVPGTVIPYLFEIDGAPKTVYIRRKALEVYVNGSWRQREDAEYEPYRGNVIYDKGITHDPIEYVEFMVTPLARLRGYVPVVLNTYRLDFNGTLNRYPELQAFESPQDFEDPYWVKYTRYDFPEAVLDQAEPIRYEDSLEISPEIKGEISRMAREITGQADTPYGKYRAIEEYLRDTYTYNENFTSAPVGEDPVAWFLSGRGDGGICTHFNSAFVLLARSVGLPARAVSGFRVRPTLDHQIVPPQYAHLWAEAPFEGLGWITFDATPERTKEVEGEAETIGTITNVTGNSPYAVKGRQFYVWGTVTMVNGSAVDGLDVEIYVALGKVTSANESATMCGLGVVRNGVFNITCEATPDLEIGDYNLTAHTVGAGRYKESWSDPPIRIMTTTQTSLQGPATAYVGQDVTLRGQLLDSSNGMPVANMTVRLEIGGEMVELTTDGSGRVSYTMAFDSEGDRNVTLRLPDTDYYLGSNSTFGISITIPPEQRGLLYMITTFPYNVITVATCAVALGTVAVYVRRRKRVEEPVEEPLVIDTGPALEDDLPLTFETYKEGIVKLFNRFYSSSRRRYPEIRESMTPREFEMIMLRKIPRSGAAALDDLVASFEIADYSTSNPSKHDFDRCQATVELIVEFMEDGEGDEE